MAIAERLLNARFGDRSATTTPMSSGDGCLMEGISHEAIDLAGHLKLNKLIVLWDDNSISIDGSTTLSTSIDQVERFKAHGWQCRQVDGHDQAQVEARLQRRSKATGRPSSPAKPSSVSARRTSRVPRKRTEARSERMRSRLLACNSTGPIRLSSFLMSILAAWRTAGERGKSAHAAWNDRLQSLPESQRSHFEQMLSGNIPAEVYEKLNAFKAEMVAREAEARDPQVIRDGAAGHR